MTETFNMTYFTLKLYFMIENAILSTEWVKNRHHAYHSDSKDEDEEEGGETNNNNSDEPLRDEVAVFFFLNYMYPLLHDCNEGDLTCLALLNT